MSIKFKKVPFSVNKELKHFKNALSTVTLYCTRNSLRYARSRTNTDV